ncbi:MAG: hypothetical protein AAGJ97_11225 [Planctomycetota bacterium]
MPEERTFDNAPEAGAEFEQARRGLPPEDDYEIEDDLATPAPEMHLRPGGELERAVHEDLDAAARSAIDAARERFADGIGEDGRPLDIDQVPGAAAEYEHWLDDRDLAPERRVRDDFDLANDHEFERD